MTENEADVPYGEDFHDPATAASWAEVASKKRPWRTDFFRLFAEAIEASPLPAPRVLELGSGPGFLAEFVLQRCPSIADYTLLDFSRPMLHLSRQRLRSRHPRPRYVCANFKLPTWTSALSGTFDFVFSMQAVHELRHKRHAADLYIQVRRLLAPTGALLVCDHLPGDEPSLTRQALYMTVEEHLAAFDRAGFRNARCLDSRNQMALFSASESPV